MATVLVMALTRAEILERFRAPVVTQADGLVKVYADCPEDMRKDYQGSIGSFAAETVRTLYQGLAKKPVRFERPGIIIHIGDVRTNVTTVTSVVSTNLDRVVSRIYVTAPGYADLYRLRLEIVQAFFRSVEKREVTEQVAVAAYRKGNPVLRVQDERMKLEDWLAGRGTKDDEEGLRMMRRVFEPGKSSPRDVLIFASRLYLYPPQYDIRFLGRFDRLSFREAVKLARTDPLVRVVAYQKSFDMPVFGGGKSPELASAANAYREFLLAFAKGGTEEKGLLALLDAADEQLNVAFEKSR